MRALGLLCSIALVCWLTTVPRVESGSQAISIFPTKGTLSTSLSVSSVDWIPNEDVELYFATSEVRDAGYSEQATFQGPVTQTRSDNDGRWNVSITPTDLIDDPPKNPFFIFFRATSNNMPDYLANANIADYAVTVGVVGPAGAADVDLSISSSSFPEAVVNSLNWRPIGTSEYISMTQTPVLPFRFTIPRLSAGEWEIKVRTRPALGIAQALLVDPANPRQAQDLCSERCGSDTVTFLIQEGASLALFLTLEDESIGSLPQTGYAPDQDNLDGIPPFIAYAGVTSLIFGLALLAPAMWRRLR